MSARPYLVVCEDCHRPTRVPTRGPIPAVCPSCRQKRRDRPAITTPRATSAPLVQRILSARHDTAANRAAAERRSTRVLDVSAILSSYRPC